MKKFELSLDDPRRVTKTKGTVMRMMKSLMAGAVATLATAAAPGIADAAPCATTTLNNWLVAGFSCDVTTATGTKTFSNFSYSPDGFTAVPATVVGVGPSFTGDPGIVFNAGWVNSTTSNLDALISFTVTETNPTLRQINDAELLISGIVATGGQDSETFFTAPGGTQIGTTALVVTNGLPTNTRVFTPPLLTVFVVDDLTVFPGGTISVLSKEFSETPVIGTPEPASLAILGISLLGIGAAYRRRTK